MDAEAVLDPAIRPEAGSCVSAADPAHIFLTGATGFLGSFLLHELLQQTEAEIHCLVRCSNEEEGKKRIERNLDAFLPGSEFQESRIIAIPGDLSKPLLGLSALQFQSLAGKIESIYHNGAVVNFIYPYDMLSSANVLGTQEVLRLASQINVKPVHFISTIGVFPLITDKLKIVREQESLDHGEILHGGYVQSKWVAEKLATIARLRGMPVSIFVLPPLLLLFAESSTCRPRATQDQDPFLSSAP